MSADRSCCEVSNSRDEEADEPDTMARLIDTAEELSDALSAPRMSTTPPASRNPACTFAHSHSPYCAQLDLLARLVALQDFDGSFELSAALAGVVAVAVEAMRTAAASVGVAEGVLATAVAVLFFETKLAHLQDDWQLVVGKARKWLRGNAAALAKAAELLQ